MLHGQRYSISTEHPGVHPFTRNRQGFDFHGSGTPFKPTRGPFVTSESGTRIPRSIRSARAGPGQVHAVFRPGDAQGLRQLAGPESISAAVGGLTSRSRPPAG